MNSEQMKIEDTKCATIKVKVPKKVLHCSDGVIEEFSDDEADAVDTPAGTLAEIQDPKTMTWGPWMLYAVRNAGSTALSACDYAGESLASFFGITTPKYQFEIEEYKRIEEEKKKNEEERKGWTEENSDGKPFTDQPAAGPTPV